MATDGSISIMVDANTGGVRNATVDFTPTGGSGPVVTTSFNISQAADPTARTVRLSPGSLFGVVAAGATHMVSVTLGGDATGFSVPASGMTGAPPSWVTMPTTGMAGSISIMVAENTGAARRATLTFTADRRDDGYSDSYYLCHKSGGFYESDRNANPGLLCLALRLLVSTTMVTDSSMEAMLRAIPFLRQECQVRPPSWVTGIPATGMAE